MAKLRSLFWTKAQTRDGRVVDVEVIVDVDQCLWLAERAARNKSRRSTSGPVYAKVTSGKRAA